ncbi:oligopeptide transport system substrate-binding protein [Kitasatospora sp. MAA4]|uniref:peptide ABC transporter substrate-binding protein n=1 Tax=Kitasatospora sp. MAA4 TaxID=3035093 RepID=UPI002476D5AE|nr:ABC transporter substrate-binding protein [Kitasatospora sp. MAA4]MDH6130747.1 oligopeptide transport system substrate-binding protein [Kitasatospora sp. MAA4]
MPGDREIRLYNYEHPPVRPLVPGDTAEHCGTRVIGLLFTGLVGYASEDATPYHALACSISTADSTVFTIALRRGWTFHDGTPVLAHNFTDAWNHTAYRPNGQAHAASLEKILGYGEVHPEDPDRAPSTDRLAGLRVLDDHAFEVTLAEPFAIFPTLLGAPAFCPLPDVFFTDRERYLRLPVGNGPYRLVSVEPATGHRLTAFEEYRGTPGPGVRNLALVTHPTRESAYQALLDGELDFLDALPIDAVADGRCERELAGRMVGRLDLKLQGLGFPCYLPGYDNPDLRKAVSLAIDRAHLVAHALGGGQRPADGWSVPGVIGHLPGQAGWFCTFDPVAARAHLARSGFTGPLEFHSPVSARRWLGELSAGVARVLGIDCSVVLYDRVRDYCEAVEQRKVTGIYRVDWAADYPALENFLRPLFHSDSPFNDSGYARPEFDALLAEADAAPDESAASARYQAAERLLVRDLPHIPLWQDRAVAGYSERLGNVRMTSQGDLDLHAATVLA